MDGTLVASTPRDSNNKGDTNNNCSIFDKYSVLGKHFNMISNNT